MIEIELTKEELSDLDLLFSSGPSRLGELSFRALYKKVYSALRKDWEVRERARIGCLEKDELVRELLEARGL